ncbi:U3 snoRNP protein [Malassezia equina]|uniref:U3 small nucleolar ribonucleoprotein protein MPP10 n=1 Tax=Malassezia equina TaxID=1381935 RepID=A0AAF0EGY5_9BASI|nr:U3 snoRNP protein [Malassezia equina]
MAGIVDEKASLPYISSLLDACVPRAASSGKRKRTSGADASFHPLFPPAELEHLVLDHMGTEQIWQQLELRNAKVARVLEHVMSSTDDDAEDESEDEDEEQDEEAADAEAMDDDDDAWVDEDEEDEEDKEDEEEDEGFAGASDFSDLDPNEVFYEPLHNEQEQAQRKKAQEREEMMRMYGVTDPALVEALVNTAAEDEDEEDEAPPRARHPTLDDDFFSIDEFNRMTEAEERRMQTQAANLSGEEPDVDLDDEIDLFAPVDEADESDEDPAESMSAADIMYKDFFDPVPQRKAPPKSAAPSEPPRRTLVRFHDQVRVRPIKQSKRRRAAALLTDRSSEDEEDEEEEEDEEDEEEEEDEEDEDEEDEEEEEEEKDGEVEEDEDEEADHLEDEDDAEEEEEVEEDITVDDDEDQDNDAQADATARRVAQDLFADEEPAPTSQLSSHERRLAELSEAIAQYEDENVREKDWTLMGEASSRERPANSLLQEDLEFERTAKAAPIQTQEHTESIDAMIRRRILDRQYDDVVRQRDVEALPFSSSNLLELSDAKSAKSLAELYEDEYQAARGSDAPSESEARLDHDRASLAADMEAFFSTLDALSNAHYTPKAPKATIQTISNTPALHMESALPTTLSTGTMLAPEEVYETPAQAPALVGARSEQSHAEKQRLHHQRRHAKRQRRERRQRAEATLERSSGAPRRGHAQAEKDQALKSLVGNKGVTVVGKDSKRRSVKDAVTGRRASSSTTAPSSGAAWKL